MAACNPLILDLVEGYMVWCRWCWSEQITSSYTTAQDLAATHEPRQRRR